MGWWLEQVLAANILFPAPSTPPPPPPPEEIWQSEYAFLPKVSIGVLFITRNTYRERIVHWNFYFSKQNVLFHNVHCLHRQQVERLWKEVWILIKSIDNFASLARNLAWSSSRWRQGRFKFKYLPTTPFAVSGRRVQPHREIARPDA